MDEEALLRLLNALFLTFSERLATTEGREKTIERYGLKASRAVEDILVNLKTCTRWNLPYGTRNVLS